MVALRIAVFLSVLAIAASCHTSKITKDKPCLCQKKGPAIIGKIPLIGLPKGGPRSVPTSSRKDDGGLFKVIDILLGGLGDNVKNSKNIFYEISHGKTPGSFDDVINVIIYLGRALGSIIDVLIPGLGGLLANLVIAIAKILICVLGGLTGVKRPGLSKQNSYICVPDYGVKIGCKRYTGNYKDHKDVLRNYQVLDASAQLEQIIKKFTRGRGESKLKLIPRLIVVNVRILLSITLKNSNSWDKYDLLSLFKVVSTLLSILGNSYKPDFGLQLIDGIYGYCSTHFKNEYDIDLRGHCDEIKKNVGSIKCWKWRGVIPENDDSQSQDQYDSDDSPTDDNGSPGSNNDDGKDTKEAKPKGNNDDSKKPDGKKSRPDDSQNKNNNNSNDNNNNSNDNNSNNNNSNNNNNNSNNNNNNSNNNNNNSNNNNNNSNNNNDKKINNNDNNKNNGDGKNSDGGQSGSSSSNININGDDDGSTILKQRDASSKGTEATDESAKSKTSSGSGKSVKNADGSSITEFNFNNADIESSKKTLSTHDDRSHELEYVHHDD